MKNFITNWEKITSDQSVLQIVQGMEIDFVDLPEQNRLPYQNHFNKVEENAIDLEIQELLKSKVLEYTEHSEGEYVSTIFSKPKPDGSIRFILNLKTLNKSVEYHHFKMDTLKSAIKLMKPGAFMASIDLRHAYYSVPIKRCFRKYLKFRWKGKLLQFTCLPNGLSSAPRQFTKLMKPVYATLRKMGYTNLGYIDDSFMSEDTYQECSDNVANTVSLTSELGFIVHPKKSVFEPTHILVFLGFLLDTINMTVKLTAKKAQKTKKLVESLLKKKKATIREVASVIGKLVSSFPGVPYGPLFYRKLECEKILALKYNKGNYDAFMTVSGNMKSDLVWWSHNIDTQYSPVSHGNPDIEISADASLEGWGGSFGSRSTGGRWKMEEMAHINCLELLAIFYTLKAFCKTMTSIHIKILSDNTTAVAYINNMGGIKSLPCNDIARQVWFWCMERNIWISAAHIPGKTNVLPDWESRNFSDNTEWQLNPQIFQRIIQRLGVPNIDLFASRLNAQVETFVSWKPDPQSLHIDAFSISWSGWFIYAFPPFSLIGQSIQKIRQDQAQGIVIVPLWPTQPWYTSLLQMITLTPLILPKKSSLLLNPHVAGNHPLIKQMTLIACLVSGKGSESKSYRKGLSTSSCNPGDLQLRSSTKHISTDGFLTVIKGKLVRFVHL